MFQLICGMATAEISTMGAYVNVLRDDNKTIFYPLSEIPDAHGAIKGEAAVMSVCPTLALPESSGS